MLFDIGAARWDPELLDLFGVPERSLPVIGPEQRPCRHDQGRCAARSRGAGGGHRRIRGIGTENVPNGPVILAPNHGSFMDHFFTGGFIRRRIRFMAKSQLFQPGIASYIFSHGGVFPVRRGHHDDEAFTTAFAILDHGEAVVMYPEGGRSRIGEIAEQA